MGFVVLGDVMLFEVMWRVMREVMHECGKGHASWSSSLLMVTVEVFKQGLSCLLLLFCVLSYPYLHHCMENEIVRFMAKLLEGSARRFPTPATFSATTRFCTFGLMKGEFLRRLLLLLLSVSSSRVC